MEPSHERLCEIFDLFEAYGFVSREDVQDMLLGIGLNYTHVQATRLCRGETDLDLNQWLDRAAVAVAAQNRENHQAVVSTGPEGAAPSTPPSASVMRPAPDEQPEPSCSTGVLHAFGSG